MATLVTSAVIGFLYGLTFHHILELGHSVHVLELLILKSGLVVFIYLRYMGYGQGSVIVESRSKIFKRQLGYILVLVSLVIFQILVSS